MNQLRTSLVRRILNRAINPYRLNDSRLYALYLALRYPMHSRAKKLEFIFYSELTRGDVNGMVFDIGANCGQKAAQFARISRLVICVEPDQAAANQLKARFEKRSTVRIINAGVGAHPGREIFYQSSPANPLNTFSRKWAESQQAKASEYEVLIITLDEMIEKYGMPQYIKIDVEGYELEVIKGLHRPIQSLSFECNLEKFRCESLECIAYLAALQPGLFNYCVSEPPNKFAAKEWLRADEITKVVSSAKTDYIEVYFKSATNQSASD
jgi:FkbM family methyltransferase